MPKMIFIERDGTKKEVEAPLGLSVLEIAHKNDIDIEGACEGSLACSTCHVIVDSEWSELLKEATEDEEDMLDLAFGLTATSRLAVYKSETLDEMRRAQALVAATLDVEIGLHIEYCRGWGLSEAAMSAEPEALETVAYTRFVLDRGLAGDRLDLEVALAPCVVGYAVIAAERIGDPTTPLEGNPYC